MVAENPHRASAGCTRARLNGSWELSVSGRTVTLYLFQCHLVKNWVEDRQDWLV
jgi:hypothetical protein